MGGFRAFQQALGEFSFAAVQKAADRELLDALVSLRQLQGGQRAFGVGEQPGGKFFQPRRGRAESGVFENEDVGQVEVLVGLPGRCAVAIPGGVKLEARLAQDIMSLTVVPGRVEVGHFGVGGQLLLERGQFGSDLRPNGRSGVL